MENGNYLRGQAPLMTDRKTDTERIETENMGSLVGRASPEKKKRQTTGFDWLMSWQQKPKSNSPLP